MIQFAAFNSFQNSKKKLTRVGLGGEGILRTTNQKGPAHHVIKEACEQGITYFDTARVYMDSEIYYGNYWKNALIFVQPETVIRWHRKGFKQYWKFKSQKPGRPSTSDLADIFKKSHEQYLCYRFFHCNNSQI
ncbi:MAG: aldo/keto reductase [Deltaproteobacteria bacterium]|uniref:aldo/keto reductase n=1 Tax=Desulfobacula sp. TaxID=2593537 RepID=UPI0019C11DBC|nr:aldo/keto reductase [Candidatus Desulfobacula maris]MBL6995840.1 aldo/keto reductase [Desulfobacula sp.]